MKDFIKKLAEHGLKQTKPRLKVWECLRNAKNPRSAREIHRKINDCDLASVYRCLSLFESIRLVQAENVNKEKLYCLADNPHHHIICRKCGYMEEFPCTHKFNKYKNFIEIEHQLTLYGVCVKCSKKI